MNERLTSCEKAYKIVQSELDDYKKARRPENGVSTMYDKLKMHYNNAMMRCVDKENHLKKYKHKIDELNYDICSLLDTLERHNIFGNSCDQVSLNLNFQIQSNPFLIFHFI
jgi:hypothetical protein